MKIMMKMKKISCTGLLVTLYTYVAMICSVATSSHQCHVISSSKIYSIQLASKRVSPLYFCGASKGREPRQAHLRGRKTVKIEHYQVED